MHIFVSSPCSKKLISGKPFAYVCRNVVLAVGASDLPNRLGLHGESLGYPWIKHELPQLEMALEKLTPRERSSEYTNYIYNIMNVGCV